MEWILPPSWRVLLPLLMALLSSNDEPTVLPSFLLKNFVVYALHAFLCILFHVFFCLHYFHIPFEYIDFLHHGSLLYS